MNPLDLPWYVVDDGKPEPDDFWDQYWEWAADLAAKLETPRAAEPDETQTK